MKITEFLQPQAVKLGLSVADQNAAIDELIALHNAAGNLKDAAAFKEAILAREAKGSTAIGMGIAVPHGKSSAVAKAGLSAITVPSGVDYKSLDGKPSNLLFMIAAPDGAADTHLEVLSKLMTMLMDANFTQKLVAAKSVDEFLKIIDEKEAEKDKEAAAKAAASAPKSLNLLAVTACPTGIAHTYMAAEALEQAAKDKGYSIKVETDGSGGAKNVLTSSEIQSADIIILAVDKNVEMGRFDGKKVIKASTANAIHNAGDLLAKAESGDVPVYHHTGAVEQSSSVDGDETLGRKFYKHLMNGVSHMLPFVIGGGILVAIAFLIDTLAGYGATAQGNFGNMLPISSFLKSVGGTAMGLMVPVLAGYIAFSIADRPGLAVGFVGGMLASSGNPALSSGDFVRWTERLAGDAVPLDGFNKFIANFAFENGGATVSGFLGGIAAGFLAGAIVLCLKKITSGFPKSLEGIKPVLIYPLCGIFLIGVAMCFVLNPIIGLINTGLSTMLTALSDANMLALLGLVLGAMMAIDMGGPINKAAYVFGTGMLATAQDYMAQGAQMSDPNVRACYIAMAAIMAGGMVPPVGIAIACKLFPKKFTVAERETWITNIIMGSSFITEGAIPFAAADPLHVIPCTMIGSGVAGLLSAIFGCTLMAPHGGIFVFATVGNPLLYIVAWLVGSVITAVLLGFLKKDKE
ncbi:PTS system, fructose-specific IIC component [Butyrivibrio fibrisolvens DSM 3071]|uniref:PTS system, fructose-specific IIC component n=1 Tax=Butyrivibrio fibrisolvens DSM 3071 TaxID=1121131 RepID=A0A1M5TQ28_BUTFI|nr:fructose-specific PTS transporter subunit EIIC [Butyrivibrio fibrisolvens]SHH52696.1 PTS system, fructose-specific IIC component [Butyrivibrio fibrisolvens DSM 3071]